MQEYIHKYLILYRRISIPKLGNFVIKEEPAYVDNASGALFPPKPVLVFEEGPAMGLDRPFFDFLTEEMGVDSTTAIQAFDDYSDKLWSDVQDHDLTVFEGLGNFTKSADGHIVFTPETNVYELLPKLTLVNEIIGLSPEKEKERAGNDYWWFYAIILLILGLGALAYYYV